MDGASVIARVIATIFFWPPDRWSPRRVMKPFTSGKTENTRASPAPAAAAPGRASHAVIWKFSSTERSGKMPQSSGA